MLEGNVAFLLQKYFGNYVRGVNKEALKISVWNGDVELTNVQLKPEALNALNLPVKVKAGFLGSVRLKVPWSRLGQEPVLVYLDRIFILAEPATQVQGCSEDAIQEAKKSRVKELELKLLESQQQLKSEMNTSWLGSWINTIIGNLNLSISNIHIRYEDAESNPGHPFAVGLMLSKLSAVAVDDLGKETFVTCGVLERILKIFKMGIKDHAKSNLDMEEHSYVLEPVTGTVDGIGASFARCLEILNNKAIAQRTRNPRAILSDGVIREYNERQAMGQMVLYLAEASRRHGCTDLFKEPSKYAWSDYYEDHFIVHNQRIVRISNKGVMLLKCFAPDKMDKRPCKILWDVPWDELLALELAKAGYEKPSHLIIHLKNFRISENFVRFIKCKIDEEEEPQAVIITSVIRKIWKTYQAGHKVLVLKVPSSQRYVRFTYDGIVEDLSHIHNKPFLQPRGSPTFGENRFIKHSLNFIKIWSSEREQRSRCTLLSKQVVGDGTVCSIWRPLCPDGYVSVGDIAHVGSHSPHAASIYCNSDGNFALPLGYDLVWRNCVEDYAAPLTIWLPRAPDGYVALGCVAVPDYEEPQLDSAFCAKEGMTEETLFEEQMVWTAPDSYPWACYIYQVKSEALQFIALRQPKEELEWKVKRVF